VHFCRQTARFLCLLYQRKLLMGFILGRLSSKKTFREKLKSSPSKKFGARPYGGVAVTRGPPTPRGGPCANPCVKPPSERAPGAGRRLRNRSYPFDLRVG
jgi:hypothetical protein